MVDEELSADTLAVVQEKARGFSISSEDGELGLLTGWTGNVLRDGINVGLDHRSREGLTLLQGLVNVADELPAV